MEAIIVEGLHLALSHYKAFNENQFFVPLMTHFEEVEGTRVEDSTVRLPPNRYWKRLKAVIIELQFVCDEI